MFEAQFLRVPVSALLLGVEEVDCHWGLYIGGRRSNCEVTAPASSSWTGGLVAELETSKSLRAELMEGPAWEPKNESRGDMYGVVALDPATGYC